MDVKHIAKLANLTINDEEEKKFATQFAETLKTINVINELDTSTTEPTSQVTGLKNVTHPDTVNPSRIIKIGRYFKVPAVFDAQ